MADTLTHETGIGRLQLDRESMPFHDWTITYTKSHILKSVCTNGEKCKLGEEQCCELCFFHQTLGMDHLPEMVFPKNTLVIEHKNGAKLLFNALDALREVNSEDKPDVKVHCAEEWQETRPTNECTMPSNKQFDWTFCTKYQGSVGEGFQVEQTEKRIDLSKLMRKERILFYHDLTLYEDELHDHGISVCSVKIRVMPSGFFILLRYFLRVDNVLVKLNDTRYYFETGVDYILKENTDREGKVKEDLKHVPLPYFTNPGELEKFIPIKSQSFEKLSYK